MFVSFDFQYCPLHKHALTDEPLENVEKFG